MKRGQKLTEFWILCLFLIITYANSMQECIGDVVSMNERVLVKMTGRPKAFLQNEITKFETLFRETFNSMTLASCVGGSYITIQSVKIQSSYLNVAEIYDQMDDSIDQTFTIRLTIDGTCRGCNKDSLFSQNFRQLNTIADIYTKSWFEARPTNPPLFVSTRKQGKQQKKRPTPPPKKGSKAPKGGKGGKMKSSPAPTPPLPCPICLPPFPIFFLTSLQMNFRALRNTGDVATIDSIESITELDEIFCEDTIQTFKTDVFGLFSGDMDLADDTKVLRLEQVFLETYNSLNLLNEATCDAYFHQIIKVKANVNVEFNSINGVFPISSQTKNRFSVQFKITCKCRGCDPNASIFSAGVSAKNNYGIMQPNSSSQKNQFMVMLQRGIQQDACFCARDAEFRTPTIREFRLALEGNINRTLELGISNTMRNDGRRSSSENQAVIPFARNVNSTVFIEKVVRLSEVDAVDCPQQIDFFEDVVEIVIFGDPDALTTEDRARLEALFVASFNEAQEGFCDPFFRTITNATLIDSLDRRNLQTTVNKTKSYKVLFRIVGYCRACPKRGLFQNDAIKSRLLLGDAMIWDEISHHGDHHHLQETTNECYCAINAIANNRTLTEEEFRFVYSRNVDGINGIDNVLNVDGFITASPSQAPSLMPSTSPTSNPSLAPSSSPSISPSLLPTESPSKSPSISPTRSPSSSPSRMPSNKPSVMPSVEPSVTPSLLPTVVPSLVPTLQPSERPIVSKSTTPQPTNQLKRPPTTPVPTQGLRRPG